ncbi:hypothetical protein MRB53_038125 [Persea americana]|nr:hypothetical protein MRB53_038125 [Persea americana]
MRWRSLVLVDVEELLTTGDKVQTEQVEVMQHSDLRGSRYFMEYRRRKERAAGELSVMTSLNFTSTLTSHARNYPVIDVTRVSHNMRRTVALPRLPTSTFAPILNSPNLSATENVPARTTIVFLGQSIAGQRLARLLPGTSIISSPNGIQHLD